MKQTAIQELIQEIEELREDNIYPESFKAIDEFIYFCYSKLEKEKQQIEMAFFKGKTFGMNLPDGLTGEQYYNETFKSE